MARWIMNTPAEEMDECMRAPSGSVLDRVLVGLQYPTGQLRAFQKLVRPLYEQVWQDYPPYVTADRLSVYQHPEIIMASALPALAGHPIHFKVSTHSLNAYDLTTKVATALNSASPESVPMVHIIHTIGKRVLPLYAALDEEFSETKLYSTLLIESFAHKVRVYQNEKRLVIVTSRAVSGQMIRRIVAITHKCFAEYYATPSIPRKYTFSEDLVIEAPAAELPDEMFGEWLIDTDANQWVDTFFINVMQGLNLEELEYAQLKATLLAQNSAMARRCARLATDLERAISSLEDSIRTKRTELRDVHIRALGADEHYKAHVIEDYIPYLTRNRSIRSAQTAAQNSRGDVELQLDIVTPARNYSKSDLELVLRRPGSGLRRGFPSSQEQACIKTFESIFIEEKATLYLRAKVGLSLASLGVRAIPVEIYDSEHCEPNTHLTRYNCFGENRDVIVKALQNNDFIATTDAVIATVSALSFLDGTVMQTFAEQLITSSRKSIHVPEEDAWYTFSEYMAKVTAQT